MYTTIVAKSILLADINMEKHVSFTTISFAFLYTEKEVGAEYIPNNGSKKI